MTVMTLHCFSAIRQRKLEGCGWSQRSLLSLIFCNTLLHTHFRDFGCFAYLILIWTTIKKCFQLLIYLSILIGLYRFYLAFSISHRPAISFNYSSWKLKSKYRSSKRKHWNWFRSVSVSSGWDLLAYRKLKSTGFKSEKVARWAHGKRAENPRAGN